MVNMTKPVLINAAKRMVRQKGALSALLVTGSDKVENGFGNGDCLLLDFSRLIFAVSDASERYTQGFEDSAGTVCRGSI